MRTLTRSSVEDIIALEYPELLPHFSAAKEVSFYGELYQLSFNQQEPAVEQLDSIFRYMRFKKKKILETMSGNAFESLMMKEKYPDNTFEASDIDLRYFEKLEGIKYRKEDCTDPLTNEEDFDFVFVGPTNVSLCMLMKEQQMVNHFKYVNRKLKKGGIYMPAYFSNYAEDAPKIQISYSTTKIEYHKYSGKFAHWAYLSHVNSESHHIYYSLVLVSNDEVLTKKSRILEGFYGAKPLVTRSWDPATIDYLLLVEGFTKKVLPNQHVYYIKN